MRNISKSCMGVNLKKKEVSVYRNILSYPGYVFFYLIFMIQKKETYFKVKGIGFFLGKNKI